MSSKIFYNGDIVTMEEDALYAEAVLVQDGKIAKIGSKDALCALDESAALIDLQGQALLPGFIDPHGHFSGCASAMLQVPLEECASLDDVVAAIKRYISNNQIAPGTWIVAKGYDHNTMKEKQHPKKNILDQAAPDNPVLCSHKSGHTGCLNSKAMEALGITADTLAPEGGVIEVIDGDVTGYMEETAFLAYQKQTPMSSMEDLMKAFVAVQERYASYGITTIQEGMIVNEMKDLYAYMRNTGMLKLDVVGYLDIGGNDALKESFSDCMGKYHHHMKIGGYKIFLDGSPQAQTAWMRTIYPKGENGYCGYPVYQNEKVVEMCKKALQENVQVLAHCNGDAAAQQYMDCYKQAKEALGASNDIRPVMVHAQLLGRDQLPMVKELGIIPTFFIAHVWHWGMVHVDTFGKERAQYISPANSALKEGIKFTFHQDPPVIEPDMMETVWCAVNRVMKNGEVLGEGEKLSVLEALKAITIHGAYQYFEEDSKGSIKEGKVADLVILEKNPLKVSTMELKEIKVMQTFKDGEAVFTR